jgi:hypothetical protein
MNTFLPANLAMDHWERTGSMKLLVSTLLIGLGIGSSGWAQQENAISSDQLDQLLRRIEMLEQTVQELREQMQSQNTTQESPPESSVAAVSHPLVPAQGQDTPANDPAIKISGYLFGDYYWMAANHDSSLEDRNGFWVRRTYLTFDKSLNPDFDMRLRLEMNSAGDFTSRSKLNPFIKDAWLRWKFTGNHQAYLGMSPTATTDSVDRIWGYRSVEKSALDLQRWGNTRDLGLALRGSFDSERKVRYHFMLGNGSGTGSETDTGKKVQMALSAHPTESITAEIYTDYEDLPLGDFRRTFQGFLALQYDSGRLGIQYAHQTRGGTSELELDVFSLWGVWKFAPRASLFARYDRAFDPNPDGAGIAYLPFDPTAKSHFFLGGIDFQVSDDFNLMPNLEVVRYDKREDGTRPTTDFVPRMTFFYKF